MDRRFLWLGALSGAIAVAAGAFGAHALRPRLDAPMLAAFETGARYQMYHALALCVVALLPRGGSARQVAGWAFVGGTLLFSGSLYALAFTGMGALGIVTPLGGAGFLVGWMALAWYAASDDRS